MSAGAAGELLLERFERPATGVERKSSATDMVSDADRDAERLIRDDPPRPAPATASSGRRRARRHRRRRPALGGRSARRHHQLSLRAAGLVGLDRLRGQPAALVGVVLDPCRGEAFTAARGRGRHAERPPDRGVTRPATSPAALIGTGFCATRLRRGRARPRSLAEHPAAGARRPPRRLGGDRPGLGRLRPARRLLRAGHRGTGTAPPACCWWPRPAAWRRRSTAVGDGGDGALAAGRALHDAGAWSTRPSADLAHGRSLH